jgi:hypothetical protein
LGGHLRFESSPRAGTSATLELPVVLKPEPAHASR